ncbi:excinuclease ABC subunit C [Bilophila wadsworthia 3_1_6]|uniref:UvrABC system protein C n=1 Tax=Bilophila wadsworthia (strain 3_1_6) TaxID=563192 RepID=E5Y853_BILW3|nr:excinuclease ABC subunit UvrC [Bilophila wadsworthia]EFV43812.1 excinuclease ABC subunit C [Bilophila wadsworthia 3_1_6]
MERPASSTLPTTPGIYIYKDAQGRIIYVGKARNLRKRILSYFRDASALTPKTVAMIGHAASLETLSTTTEKEALLLEASLIKKHRPHYNIVLRDDKQYVLFRIAKDAPYPRLEVVRQARRDNARYFGPFTSGQAARETWKTIHRVFPLRRCVDRAFKNRVRPCLYHHIGQCLAPCTENVPVEEYASLIHRVELLLSGRSRELLDTLRHAMADASEAMNYEQAAVFRDQIKAIERTVERQSVVLPEGGNMDVAGVAPAKGGLALGLLFVREGRLVDGRTFFWPDLELAEGPELLWSFLGQFYGPQTSIPPRIVVPWLPEDTVLPGMSGEQDAPDSASPVKDHIATLEGEAEPPHAAGTDSNGHAPDEVESLEALEAALADARGGIVRIAKPRNAAEARLVDMAVSNAREAAVTKSEVPMSDRLAAAFALDKVQSALPGAVPMASRPIRRIECVDVSHTGGTSTRVGMVVFEDGQPQKSDYRTYALEGEAACNGDDYAALAEWMRRRLESGPPWADLVLIDGGRGQVSAVQRIVRESNAEGLFLLAGIAKARDDMGRADRRAGNVGDRIFLPGRSNPLPLRDGSAELLFLQHIRDTAHHFVIGRHRRARAGAALSAELLRIPGVGKATARLLWDHFKALDAIIAATPAQLAAIPGIGPRKAEALAGSLKRLKE